MKISKRVNYFLKALEMPKEVRKEIVGTVKLAERNLDVFGIKV